MPQQNVTIQRMGSETVDSVEIEKFLEAVKRTDPSSGSIYINGRQYDLRTAVFSSPNISDSSVIEVANIDMEQINAGPAAPFITLLFVNAKPLNKFLRSVFFKNITPFANAAGDGLLLDDLIPKSTNLNNQIILLFKTAGNYQLHDQKIFKAAVNDIELKISFLNNTGDPTSNPKNFTAGQTKLFFELSDFPAL